MFDLQSLIKYLLEGAAVAVAAYLIPKKKVDPKEIALIALTAAAVFAVLDQFAPLVGAGARQGAGFGIGLQRVGWGGGGGFEGFDDSSAMPAQPIPGMEDGEMEGYDDYETFSSGHQSGHESNNDSRGSGSGSNTDNRGSVGNNGNGNNSSNNGSNNDSGRNQNSPSEQRNHEGNDHKGLKAALMAKQPCKMVNGTCSFSSSDDENVVTCQQESNGNCKGTPVCIVASGATTCSQNPAVTGTYTCNSTPQTDKHGRYGPAGGQYCTIAAPSTTTSTESFYGGDGEDISAFEGFSKVF